MYLEANPKDAPVPFTAYPVSGLRGLATPPTPAQARGLYNSTTNELYYCCGNQVLLVRPDWSMTSLGTIGSFDGICSMVDNGTTLVLVDGTTTGYQIDLLTHALSPISEATNGPSIKRTATVATTVALPTATYANGVLGVGATLTAIAVGVLTVDGVAVGIGMPVLVKDQGAASENGLYVCTTAGSAGAAFVLTRSTDMDTTADFQRSTVPVGPAGTTNANTLWLVNPPAAIAVGSGAVVFILLDAASLPVYDFNGGTRVDIIDGYIITNDGIETRLPAPPLGTRAFRSTYLNQIVWDSLWFADKNGYSDNLVAVIVQKREIWLIGEKTTEIWFNAGLPDFPFAIMPGPFIQHGCIAPYSIAAHNGIVYWLTQDQSGKNILARGEGYKASPVSTPALVTEWSTYERTDDAIGFCFQQNDHPFYQLTFPTADKTWRYDESTGQWHEAVWVDDNGGEHRHRAQCHAFAYGVNVVGDYLTGQLYALDPYAYSDNGRPMVWRRGFPHLVDDGNRVIYPGFALDMEVGAALTTQLTGDPILATGGAPLLDDDGTALLAGPGDETPIGYPVATRDLPMRLQDGTSMGLIGTVGQDAGATVWLRWSDDRGKSWSSPVAQSFGTGEFLAQLQWSRTGAARDRVYECYGSIMGQFAIQGAWLSPAPIKLRS